MADNVSITAGSGTTIRTDEVGATQIQVVKIALGADGAEDNLVDAGQQAMAASVPVAIASNQSAIPVTDNSSTLSIDDGGGAITVDGTVAVTNAGITTIAGAVAGTEMQVDVVAALPAGDNNIGNVDLASAIPAGTNNIGDVDVLTLPAVTIAAAQTLATVTTVGAVTAITNALPAGTNAIGKLSANSGVDIGDVDVTSIAAGTNIIGATRDAGPSWTVVRTYTTSSNMTTAADLTAAPTSGQKIVLDDLIVSCGTDMVLSLQEETSGTVIMALSLTAKSPVQITPRDGLKLPTADRKLQGDASEAGTLYITACYHSEA